MKPKTPITGYGYTFRSQTEHKYADRLQKLKLAGEIYDWQYEADKLILAERTTYTPDFKLWLTKGRFVYHEVKGWSRNLAAGMVKFKVAVQMFPNTEFYLVKEDKIRGWSIKRFRAQELG